jgi:hypothetical protein
MIQGLIRWVLVRKGERLYEKYGPAFEARLRRWRAFLALAFVGAVGLNYEARFYDFPDGPAYVAEAGPLSASECRAWRSRAQRRAAAFPGSLDAFEGFSRLQGTCHPQDLARGRALIEGAIAKGAGRFLIVEYVLALRAAGDTVRANGEFPVAVEAMRNRLEIWFLRVPSSWRPLVVAAKAELEAETIARDWRILQARVDHILSRPALLPDEEWLALFRTFQRMSMIDYPESLFQSFRSWRAGRYEAIDGEGPLRVAAACGHADAIRVLARLSLEEGRSAGSSGSALRLLIWLHARTGAEDELVLRLRARQPFSQFDLVRENQSRASWIASHCQPKPDLQAIRNRERW